MYKIISVPELEIFFFALRCANNKSKKAKISIDLGVVRSCGSRGHPCNKPIPTENVAIRQIVATEAKDTFIIRGHCDAALSESQEPEFYKFEIINYNKNTLKGEITFSR